MADDLHEHETRPDQTGDRDEATGDVEETGTSLPEVSDPPGPPLTGWQRLSQTFLHPPGPRTAQPKQHATDLSELTDDERRARINRIDPTERKVGIAAGVLAAVFALVYTIPHMVSKISVATTVPPARSPLAPRSWLPVHASCPKYHYTVGSTGKATCNGVLPASHYIYQLIFLLVFAVAILVTVRIGRRAPLAFAIVLTGLAFGVFFLLLPFLVAGGWLLLRAWRTQRYGSPTAREPVEGYVRPPPGASRRTVRPDAGAKKGRKASDAAPPERKPPVQSKRYTPKSPPRRRPPPS